MAKITAKVQVSDVSTPSASLIPVGYYFAEIEKVERGSYVATSSSVKYDKLTVHWSVAGQTVRHDYTIAAVDKNGNYYRPESTKKGNGTGEEIFWGGANGVISLAQAAGMIKNGELELDEDALVGIVARIKIEHGEYTANTGEKRSKNVVKGTYNPVAPDPTKFDDYLIALSETFGTDDLPYRVPDTNTVYSDYAAYEAALAASTSDGDGGWA